MGGWVCSAGMNIKIKEARVYIRFIIDTYDGKVTGKFAVSHS